MLMGPGRWGTTTPSLGVTVSFQEIEHVTYLCEIVDMGEHPVPEVSLGTHFFSEMVEMDMLYMVFIPEKETSFMNHGLFEAAGNRLTELAPEAAGFEDVVRVVDAADFGADMDVMVHANTVGQKVLCYLDASGTADA